MKYKWYIINVRSGFEKNALLNIQSSAKKRKVTHLFRRFIIPTTIVYKNKGKYNISIEKKLLPSYLIIKLEMNYITWFVIKSSNYVSIGRPRHFAF